MAIATAAAVSHASSSPLALYCAPKPTRSSHGPTIPAASHPDCADAGDDRRRCDQRPQPVGAFVDEMRDEVALHGGQRHQQRRAGQRHGQDDHAALRAELIRLVSLSSTGKPITRIALAPAAVIEWAAPRKKVAVLPGVEQAGRRACRRRGRQHDQPGHRAGHGRPQETGQAPADHERGRRDRHPDERVGHHQRPVLGPPVGAGQHAEQGGVQTKPGQADATAAPPITSAPRRTPDRSTTASCRRSRRPRLRRPWRRRAADECVVDRRPARPPIRWRRASNGSRGWSPAAGRWRRR